jgi:hypothetical protein
LLNKVKKTTNETTPIWVYKNVDGTLILIDKNKPSYSSAARSALNIPSLKGGDVLNF